MEKAINAGSVFQTCNGLLQQPVTNMGCARRVSSSLWYLGNRNAVKKKCLVNFLVITGRLVIEYRFHSQQSHPWLDTMAESKGQTSSALELARARSG